MTTQRLPGPPLPERITPPLLDHPGLTPEAHLADCIAWWDAATVAVWQIIAEGRPFDAHTITERVGRPFPDDGRRVASFLQRHSRDGNIRRVDYRLTRRPTSQAIVAVWQPTDQGRRTAAQILPAEGAA